MLMLLVAAGGAAAKDLDDRSIRIIMEMAWDQHPTRFTGPDRKTIITDKSKKAQIIVPIAIAREVIRVARLTAAAESCSLFDEATLNQRTLMKTEELKKKWSDQQLLYIAILHAYTVNLALNKLEFVEQGDGKTKSVKKKTFQSHRGRKCTQAEIKVILDKIQPYVLKGPLRQVKPGTPQPKPATPAAVKK